MRRWNGWGDEANSPPPLPDHAREFLASKLGKGQPLPEAEWNEVITQVPASRLPDHPLITTCSTDRVLHARGQSLPDWLALRSGKLDIFPDGVAYPECREDIQELLSYASTHSVEVIPYGGGTSVAGHITPRKSVRPILTIDLCRMNRLINLDTDSQIATSGPGTSGPLVESQLRAKGYTLGHFPQSFELSTLGGWVASRSSGQQSLRYGRIEQLFAGGCLETFAGPLEIPSVPASAAGPDLREIILGSEGRIGILSEIKVRVSRQAEAEQFYVAFLPDWKSASGCTRELVQQRVSLSMLRVSNAIETVTQLQLAGHQKAIKLLESALTLFGAQKNSKCMMTFGITGAPQQNQSTLKQVRKILKTYKGVGTSNPNHLFKQLALMLVNIRERLFYLHFLEIHKTQNTGKYVVSHRPFTTNLKVFNVANLLDCPMKLLYLPVMVMNLDEVIALERELFRQVNHVVATLVF